MGEERRGRERMGWEGWDRKERTGVEQPPILGARSCMRGEAMVITTVARTARMDEYCILL